MLENTQGNAENINKNVNQDIKLRVQDEDTQQMTDHMADPSSYYNYRLQQNSTSFSSDPYCFRHRQSIVILAAFAITYIVVFFPLCILILYQGLKKWMKNPGLSSASAQVCDGINNGHVALHTGQGMEAYLPIPGERKHKKSSKEEFCIFHAASREGDDVAQRTIQFHNDQVVFMVFLPRCP
ncbi:uncharacterized protein LOC110367370 isoform X3 [Fundulus heteroclitus]|uniref:uncharacterized protein LOC110367370 isoform X3 n=1 Tax=Fundulus heteroclitus TaxID=8078 RepID=UPI00165C7579|nr:uncharacterized protein LOC110367370 isoform X3 [Fundulus heteroclitus]